MFLLLILQFWQGPSGDSSAILNVIFAYHSHCQSHFKNVALREKGVIETIWIEYVTEPS